MTYECQAPPPGRHRTFSLLPWPLIPYRKRGVDFLRMLVVARANGTVTYLQATTTVEARMGLSVSLMGTLHDWLRMAEVARLKWSEGREQDEEKRDLDELTLTELGEVCQRYASRTESFLYGTPSQERPAMHHCRSP